LAILKAFSKRINGNYMIKSNGDEDMNFKL